MSDRTQQTRCHRHFRRAAPESYCATTDYADKLSYDNWPPIALIPNKIRRPITPTRHFLANRQGVAVAMIHGEPGSHKDFDPIVAELPGLHLISIDRPGFGWSKGGWLP